MREERSLPLCNTAACGEDSELKVVALQLAIVHSLCIVIVGVVHSRGFSRTGLSTLNPVSTLFSVFPIFCCIDSCFLGCGREEKVWKASISITMEPPIGIENIREPIVALIDHGSEINLMSKEFNQKGRCPINTSHQWKIRHSTKATAYLFVACADVTMKIRDVEID